MDPETLTELQEAFAAFRQHNDQRLDEIERTGRATAATAAAAERANAEIERIQNLIDEHARERAELQARVDEVETRLNRPLAGRGSRPQISDERMERYAAWQSVVTRQEVDPAHVDLELITSYRDAFRDYLRGRPSQGSLEVLNELQVGSDPDGGHFVDPDTNGRMVEFIHQTSPVRRLASVQAIESADALEGTVELGEAGAGWVGEQDPRPETATPQVFEWRVPLREQYAEPRATQRVIDQARLDVSGWLLGRVQRRFARLEGTAFTLGNGVKQPRGYATYPAGVPGETEQTWPRIEQVVSGAAATVAGDGLLDLVYALKEEYREGAVFGMSRTTEREVRQLKDGQDNYLWQPDFQQLGAARLIGYPIATMPDLPAVAAGAVPIVFGHFGEAYQIVDSVLGMRVLRDPYTTKGKVKFYTTRYVGGDVINFEALKLQVIST